MHILCKIFILWLCFYPVVEAAGNYKIQTKSVKCFNVDPHYFTLVRCYIRAERGRRGLLNVILEINKPLHALWDQVQVFSKTSAGTFQPWAINVDLNACDASKVHINKIFGLFLTFFETYVPNLKKGCPFSGVINFTDWEFDKEAHKLLPPIIPEGIFLIHHRAYIGNNHTIFEVNFGYEVRPIGTAELIKLG